MSESARPSSSGPQFQPRAALGRVQPGSAGGAKQEPFLTVPLVIRALRRWWKIATPLGLVLAAAAGTAMYLLFEPVYEASAWLQIEDRPPYIAFQAQNDSSKFVQTQVEIIRSPLVLGPVLGRQEIAELEELRSEYVQSPLDHLAKNLKIKSVGGSELFTVSWQGPRAADAARIVNAVVDTYMELRQHQESERMQRVIELVEQERARQENQVELLQQRVRELTKQVTGKDPFAVATDQKTSDVVQEIASLQSRLTETEVQKVFVKAEIDSYEKSAPQTEVGEVELERAVAEHPQVRALEARRAHLETELAHLETTLAKGKGDFRYQAKLVEVQQQDDVLKQLRDELRTRIRKERESLQLAQNRDRLKQLQSELKSMELTEEVLKKRVEEARKNINASSEGSVELAFLQGDLSREEEVFERIASRLMALRTEQRAPERVNRLQSAEVPTAPVVSVATLYKKMGLACFGSFLLPFALAVLRERLLQRVGDVRQLREDLHLPVVGQIAQLPLRAHSLQQTASRRAREDLQLFQESVDALRVCLMTSESLQDMRVLAVTSAANNEGKTSVAVQLAVSIAGACGEKTLLIDGDLRSPDVHRVLGVAGRPGLAELLAHECRIEDGAIQNWSNRVDVLPAGRLGRNPHRLLGNGAFGELLEELRRRYRYIVIDTPPVLAASEAVILARAADACLLCAMRDVSRVEQVREVGSRLAVAGAEPVGIVLSGIPSRQYGYYYGRYSYKIEA